MQSVNNKLHLLEDFIEGNQNVHTICLTETWFNEEKLKLFNLPGYPIESSFCRKSRREAARGGGVCILTKENQETKTRNDIVQLSLENIFEICAVELPRHNILIINLYWPNSSINKEKFFDCLENLLKLLSLKDVAKTILIGGDFNVNFLTNSVLKTL